MSNEIKKKINEALFNFYLEADKDIIFDSLKDDIHDFVEYNKKKKQIIFLANAISKKQHNDSLMELVTMFQEAINLNIEKPISLLKHLIQENTSLALYRNLDKLSKEDIVEIIKDKNLVQLIEFLENKNENI